MNQELSANTNLSHYRIVSKIGAGGMGEVYRAKDTRLDREVAIKVLPASFANDADRLRRFEQEARATSALNHPNILTIHDIGTHDGSPYIVAELLDGAELREEMKAGALPARKAIDYALQTARGLSAAHEKGITHRDLKPENLFVTTDGRVKILDFGLAKLRPPKLAGGVDSEAPTRLPLTDPGAVMGTVGYMSPEQVRGQDADHRADIFAFGVILYEMLAGRRAFEGESVVETMNAILKEEPPDLTETNSKIPAQLERVVRRCLEKRPGQRFQSASDLGFALEALSTVSGSRLETAAALPAVTESLPGKARLFGNARLWMAIAAVAVLVALASLPLTIAHLRHSTPAEPVAVRFTIAAPEKVTALFSPMISPDGRNVVFLAVADGKLGLWLRPLGSLTAQPLPGSEMILGLNAWSPDSRSIAFPADGKLKRLDLGGGAPQTLCSLPRGWSPGEGAPAWNREGVILFTAGGSFYRVPATGGEPALVLGSDQPNREARYRWPAFLPDGHHFLYLRTPTQQGASEIYLASLDGKETTRLLAADSQVVYAASATGSGYLLFARAEALLAQPFDAGSLKLTGEPFVVAEKVAVNSGIARGSFSVSDNGSLVYDSTGALDNNQQLTWVDRAGKPQEPVGSPGTLVNPRLSPDGKRVAVERRDPQTKTLDIYVIDLARGASSRLTFDPANDRHPIWSPDGSRIAWWANREGTFQIYQKLASGVGQEELLLKSDVVITTDNWSPDGRFILYTRVDPKTKSDLWLLPLEGDRQPFLFLQTPFSEGGGRFSPDGRWIAYHSDDQGRSEVYVQTFPASGGKWQISTNGGSDPRWRGDGKELFYGSGGKLMAVEVKPSSSFEAGVPKMLFDLTPLRAVPGTGYAVTADGQRFLIVTLGQGVANFLQYTVVVNWAAEAKR